MTWMLTATGTVFELRLIDMANVDILDVAHSLANINRYTGHAARPMSVAEHSLLVEEIMQRELAEHRPAVLLAALLHDAHEAYTGDMGTPMKQLLGEPWHREEERIQRHVLRSFGLWSTSRTHRQRIKQADLIALATERRDLLPPCGPAWPVLDGVSPASWINLQQRAGLSWQDWRQAFVDRFSALRMAAQGERELA
jgi:5'-deoxynucleotidase YfbR-like HD superfamily hydrolase